MPFRINKQGCFHRGVEEGLDRGLTFAQRFGCTLVMFALAARLVAVHGQPLLCGMLQYDRHHKGRRLREYRRSSAART